MRNFFSFRTMVTPALIEAIFLVGLLVLVAVGLFLLGRGIRQHDVNVLYGAILLLLGPLALRVTCESMIVAFRIHSTLGEIADSLDRGG